MGNSRSRQSRSRRSQSGGGHADLDVDIRQLAQLLILRQELTNRQESLRQSLHLNPRRPPSSFQNQDDARPGRRTSAMSFMDLGQDVQGARIGALSRDGFFRNFLRHQIFLDVLNHYPDLLDEINENGVGVEIDENDTSDDGDNVSLSSSTYEGVGELFAHEEAQYELSEKNREEEQVQRRAEKIRTFKQKVLSIFESEKEEIESKINSAMEVQVILRSLLSDQMKAKESNDRDKISHIKSIVDEIHKSDDFADQKALSSMGSNLDSIKDNLDTLKELMTVKVEDEVLCTVCLASPVGAIWDCVKCDQLVCDTCKLRLASCPTCRVRFKSRKPRRNRWAEKLARLQREKALVQEED